MSFLKNFENPWKAENNAALDTEVLDTGVLDTSTLFNHNTAATYESEAIISSRADLEKKLNQHLEDRDFCAILGFNSVKSLENAIRNYKDEKKNFMTFLSKAMSFTTKIYKSNGIKLYCYYYDNAELFIEYETKGVYGGKMFLVQETGVGSTLHSNLTEYVPIGEKALVQNKEKYRPLKSYKTLGFFIAHEYLHQLLGRVGYVLYNNTNHLCNDSWQHTNFNDFYNLNTEGGNPVNGFDMPFNKDFYRIWKPQLLILRNYSKYMNDNIDELTPDLVNYLEEKEGRISIYRQRLLDLDRYGKGINLEKHDDAGEWKVDNWKIDDEEIQNRIHDFNIDIE